LDSDAWEFGGRGRVSPNLSAVNMSIIREETTVSPRGMPLYRPQFFFEIAIASLKFLFLININC